MKRLILILLIFIPAVTRAAVGDITGADILDTGWQARLFVEGLNTNGNVFAGLGPNNSLTGMQAITLTVTSMGFDSSGAPIERQRKVYGTEVMRAAYPMQNTNDIHPDGAGGCIVKFALSDWIFAKDSNITLTALSGAYAVTNGTGTNCNAVSGLSVTNDSTQSYPKVIANWTWPGAILITNSPMILRAVGFHGMSGGGQPLACMKFVAEDESGNSNVVTVSEMSIGYGLPDLFRTGEYTGEMDVSGFTDNDAVRCDFAAYPQFGDEASVLETRDDVWTFPTALPSSITNVVDLDLDYSGFIAVVDPAGNDSNGRSTNTTYSGVSSSHYFLTMAGAANAIASSNNTHRSRNDVGGGIVYMREGSYIFAGATVSAGVTPHVNITFQRYPGDGEVKVWDDTTSYGDITDRVRFFDMSLSVTNPNRIAFGCDYFWLDQCEIKDSPATQWLFNTKVVWVTHCTIGLNAQGFRYVSGQSGDFMMRGNDFTSAFAASIGARMTIGNRVDQNTTSYSLASDFAAMPTRPDYIIVYNNFFGGMDLSGASPLNMGSLSNVLDGAVIAQNVFESTETTVNTTFFLHSAASTHTTNVVVWDNVLTGARVAGYFYNDTGSTPQYRYQVFTRGNISDNTGFKSDTFSASPDGGRDGNWPIMWMAGASGNFWLECNSVSGDAAGDFNPDFAGLFSYHPLDGVTNGFDYIQYADRQSRGSGSTGGGTYRLLSSSPAHGLTLDWALPYDIEGNARGKSDPPGPHSSGNVKKGGFF